MRRLFLPGLLLCAAGVVFADAVTYTYDDAGRLTSVNYPNGTVIAYTYDPAGNLTSRTVTGGSGSSSADKTQSKAKAKQKSKTTGEGAKSGKANR